MLVFVIICISIIISFIAANLIYKRTNDYKNTLIQIQGFNKYDLIEFKLICLGSTYAKYAFDSIHMLGIKGENLSLFAESLECDKQILKKYVNKCSDNCLVFITIGACVMLYQGETQNLLLYKVLKYKEIPKHSIRNYICSSLPLIKNKKKILRIISDSVPLNNIYETISIRDTNFDNILKGYVDGWLKLFSLNNLKDANLNHCQREILIKNIDNLRSIIDICLKNKLRPIVVVPPFSDKLNNYFGKSYCDEVVENSVKQAIKNKNVPFFNYQFNTYFQDKYNLFIDGGFRLNEKGSEVFIKILARDLIEYGIELNNQNFGTENENN